MLRVALLLLSIALSYYLWNIDTAVAFAVPVVTLFGALFYLFTVIAGIRWTNAQPKGPLNLIARYHGSSIGARGQTKQKNVSISCPRTMNVLLGAISSLTAISWNLQVVMQTRAMYLVSRTRLPHKSSRRCPPIPVGKCGIHSLSYSTFGYKIYPSSYDVLS